MAGPTPLTFDQRPQPFNGVKGTTVGGQEQALIARAPLAIHHRCSMGSQVIHNHQAAPGAAFQAQRADELQEGLLVVGALEDRSVNDASDLTDGADNCNGWAPVVIHLERHALLLPHPAWAHPQVEGGLI